MKGYWNNPEATAEVLWNGWMYSDDLGYMAEKGYVFVVDRLKDMIITEDENGYSVEAENTIYQHPAVAFCAVIGLSDENGGDAIRAVVSPKPDHMVAADEMMAHCRPMLAG